MLQTLHQSHQRALAAARTSDKCHVVTAIDGQVESVEEQRHVIGIAEFQATYLYLSSNALYHLAFGLDFCLFIHKGTTELNLWQQTRHHLCDSLQLEYGQTDNAKNGTIGNIVRESHIVVPCRPHRYNHGQEPYAIADAGHIEAGQWLAAAIHLRRRVCLCPPIEGPELRTSGLDLLNA